MKICMMCKENKINGDFYAAKNSPDGLNRYCKHCCKVNRALEAVRKRDKRSRISYRQVYRANELGVITDPNITLAFIFKKDLGICGICGLWVPPSKASPDHIKPLSKGGTHEVHNLQISHIKCNLKKGDR